MSQEADLKVDEFLDICEEVCPMSFILTKKRLDSLEDGQVLEVLCQAGESLRSISIQMKDEGHLIKSVKREDENHFRIQIVKGGGEG